MQFIECNDAERLGQMKDCDEQLTIIGIGSSAGGLEAIRELVVTLPSELPVSYVVVQHMAPQHKSLMTELVARQTNLKVMDVVDEVVPQRNVIYITPPNTDVVFEGGCLRLRSPSEKPARPKPSVNRFLASLAENHGAKSMAVILSGTGTDGAYGVQAIREVGGITIAQDAESAKYDGMPLAAAQTGCVDLILPPAEIGQRLGKILSSAPDFPAFRSDSYQTPPHSDLLQILLARTRVDFREYKNSTVSRRIERQMIASGITDLAEYTLHCRNNPHAVDALFKDLLISVTRFFRDQQEFRQLGRAMDGVLKEAKGNKLRVWVAGCATGEEAYSIAILLAEALGGPDVDLPSKVQIFATDIDKDALNIARGAAYPIAALNDIPADLADKYVVQQGESIRMIDNLRKAILFSDHNVCNDPPFQRVDVVCCRNLLIYFDQSLQKRVISRFHYGMTEHAIMFLGTAESVAGSDEWFVQDRSAPHIFRKRQLGADRARPYSLADGSRLVRGPVMTAPSPSTDRKFFDALAQSLGQNSILVSDDYKIVRVYGDVSRFVEISEMSKLQMHLGLLRSPWREEARSLVTIALQRGVHRTGVRHLLSDNGDDELRLDVYPIIAKGINERVALVVFTPVEIDRSVRQIEEMLDGEDAELSSRVRALQSEVDTTREALQQTIEELETSNEEMQSLNEEMQSTNEELQATNEELETSNEELQSTNEELITVNEELQVTATQLRGRTIELVSVLETTPLAIIVLDTALQIVQVTDPALDMFEIKRPVSSQHISQCVLPVGFPVLAPICSEALQLGEPVIREFASEGGQIKLTVAPYFEEGGRVQGVTLVVSDFPGLAEEMEMILKTDHIYLMHRNRDGQVLRISNASAASIGITPEAAIGRRLDELVDKDAAEQVLASDKAFLEDGETAGREVVKMQTPNMTAPIWLELNRYAYTPAGADGPTVYSVATDVSESVMARDAAQGLLERMRALQDFAGVGYWEIDLTAETLIWSDEVHRIHRTDPATFVPVLETGINFYHPDDRDAVSQMVQDVIENGGNFKFQKRLVATDGQVVWVESHGRAVLGPDGDVTGVIGFFRELGETEVDAILAMDTEAAE
ncbi:chemotaxis protein CheB [Yoonia sp. SS1-5]|uniref:Chemotaxis protein CheB n=2 Tax=Yoonia rhodophyticola TaxID=3137370 RepID=A0AAN0MJ31_9RHOB